MNKQNNIKTILSALVLTVFLNGLIVGQSTKNSSKPLTDSLSLKGVIQQVISTYPTVKIAEEAIRNADSRISLARTGYNPLVDMTASFANLGPVTKLNMPSFGTFQLYPGNNLFLILAGPVRVLKLKLKEKHLVNRLLNR
jgi:hypothetical protein